MTQHDQGEAARQQAQATAQQARDSASQAAQQAKDRANAAAEQTKRATAEYAQQAKERGAQMLDEQKHNAASQLHTFGEAARRASGKFRDEHDDNIAGYIDAVAQEADRFADYLDHRDLGTVMHDAQDFARRRPELFLGGMFVAGLALTRFLKSSQRHEWDRREEHPGETAGPGFVMHASTQPELPSPQSATGEFRTVSPNATTPDIHGGLPHPRQPEV